MHVDILQEEYQAIPGILKKVELEFQWKNYNISNVANEQHMCSRGVSILATLDICSAVRIFHVVC